MNDIRIAFTKKISKSFEEKLQNAGLKWISSDFIQISPNDFSAENVLQNLIFTSQNAVESFRNHSQIKSFKNKKTFCVGLKTKQKLIENGFLVADFALYASDLAHLIIDKYSNETFTFINGNLRRDDLPTILSKNEVVFNEIEVYQTVLTPVKWNDKYDACVFFSPSAVESFLKENSLDEQICFCIGKTTAQALKNHYKGKIHIASEPSLEVILDEIIKYYKK